MSIETRVIVVNGLSVQVVRKAIKNLHLGVYPPNGRVRVAVPFAVSDEVVRLAVIGKLGWIRKHQTRFAEQARQTEREMASGESHYLFGRRYRLDVVEDAGDAGIRIRNNTTLELSVPLGANKRSREAMLHGWYRQLLREQILPLIPKWESVVGVQVEDWRIKRMKTRWGTCTASARRIWLNLELAKKPPSCLEFVLVHEMVHLLERHHNEQFAEYMDRFMPLWRLHREELNQAPLGHESWSY